MGAVNGDSPATERLVVAWMRAAGYHPRAILRFLQIPELPTCEPLAPELLEFLGEEMLLDDDQDRLDELRDELRNLFQVALGMGAITAQQYNVVTDNIKAKESLAKLLDYHERLMASKPELLKLWEYKHGRS